MKIEKGSRKEQRSEALERAEYVSELTGEGKWGKDGKEIPLEERKKLNVKFLEACHVYHGKNDLGMYLNPNTVIICTPLEHYVYHLFWVGRADIIGLTEEENNSAIKATFFRAKLYFKKRYGRKWEQLTYEEQQKIINRIKFYWSSRFAFPIELES